MKKSEIKKLDKKWSEKVKENAKFRCELSGISNCVLNSHHYVGRRNRATRWYLPNGICLSFTYHKGGTKSAHENPEYFRGQMLNIRGQSWLDDLIKQSNKTCKTDYDAVLKYLNGKIENYC